MTFNRDVQLDTSGVSSGGRRAAIGGGIGGFGLLGALLFFLVTGQVPSLDGLLAEPGPAPAIDLAEECRTGADANARVECRMVAGKNSMDAYWNVQLPSELGVMYKPAALNLYSGSVATGCGTGSAQMGPFYCPADQTIYIDTTFFNELDSMGASNQALAQLYILAHEYGHHVQQLAGDLQKVDHRSSGESSSMVRSELQADCLAGAWIHNASSTTDAQGTTFMQPPTQTELADALAAAQAVGDDRIYESAGMQVNPDNFSHGSSEKRMEWLSRGISGGTYGSCDTWSVPQP